jgi:hypothetical protein
MRLLSFNADGKHLFCVVNGDGVVTLNGRIGQPTLRDALAADSIGEIRKLLDSEKPDRKLADIGFLPVIPRPEKILCAGINYRAHAAEAGRELPAAPSLFARFADTLVGHDSEMIRPRVSEKFDFEGELAVIIGKSGRHIKPERRSITSPAIAASSTAACAIIRNSPSPPGKIFRPQGRSVRGSSPPMKFPIQLASR